MKEKTTEELVYVLTDSKVDVLPDELTNATPESLGAMGFQDEAINTILAAMELAKRVHT